MDLEIPAHKKGETRANRQTAHCPRDMYIIECLRVFLMFAESIANPLLWLHAGILSWTVKKAHLRRLKALAAVSSAPNF